MKIIQGDILKADVDIICQQVNCMGVMGSGLAKQIREKFPEVYNAYKEISNKYTPNELLGKCQFVEAHNARYFANIFGQLKYGRDRQHTSYEALKTGLKYVAERARRYEESVAIPYGIGCGLGGGDWNIVSDMIEELFEGCNFAIYKL